MLTAHPQLFVYVPQGPSPLPLACPMNRLCDSRAYEAVVTRHLPHEPPRPPSYRKRTAHAFCSGTQTFSTFWTSTTTLAGLEPDAGAFELLLAAVVVVVAGAAVEEMSAPVARTGE